MSSSFADEPEVPVMSGTEWMSFWTTL